MGTDMWHVCLQLCCIATVFSGRGEGLEFPGNLSCLNNYIYRMDCTWETDGRVGDGPFHVHFKHLDLENKDSSCTLTARDELQTLHHCTMNMAMFSEMDRYRVSLQGGFFGRDHTYVAFLEYEPRLNIKYDPPFNLQSNISSSKCQLWWSVPWSPLEEILQYELEYKEHNASWEQAQHKKLFNSVTEVQIEAIEFEAGITYTARVRCKTSQAEESYESHWSEWSQTTEFQRATTTDFLQVPEKSFDTSMTRILFIPLCLGIVLYIILNFRLSSRAKNIFCLDVPTPAAFFQPLYTLHNGNFKDWVGPNETCDQLSRDEANNPNKVTVDGVPDLSAHEAISQLSCKSLAKTKMILPEEICGPVCKADQQHLRSSGNVEARLTSLFLQHHGDEAGALDVSETSETTVGSADVSRNHSPYLREGAGDFFMPQESLELESLSFCSNDYCTLCGSDSTGGRIPADLLQLTKKGRLAKHENDGNDSPSLRAAAYAIPQV